MLFRLQKNSSALKLQRASSRLFGVFVMSVFLFGQIAPGTVFAKTQDVQQLTHKKGELVVLFKGSSLPVRIAFSSEDEARAALLVYKKNPQVAEVSWNSLVQVTAERITPDDEYYSSQWYLEKIHAPEAWKISQGSRSVVVAVLDTGVFLNHPDLRNNIWTNPREVLDGLDNDGNGYPDDIHGWDFVDDVGDPQPHFTNGWTNTGANHGTAIAGIIGAVGNNTIGIAGVTWNVRIMSVRVLDSQGLGDVATVAKGIDYAVRNGAQIINMSFVGFEQNEVLSAAILRAHEAGVTIVAAAGNDDAQNGGKNLDANPNYPVCLDGGPGENDVIGVTAIDEKDVKAVFAGYGAHCVDIAAPGVGIWSTRYQNLTIPGLGDAYGGFWQGTSLATAVVTGAAALIKGINPALTSADIANILKKTADPIDDINPLYKGKLGGRLNLYQAAVAASSAVPTSSVSRALIGTGAGAGSPPEVKLFTRDGSYVRSFLAYAVKFLGGVHVVSGDLDADLRDEIVTAPASNGGPHIRIFDSNSNLKKEFFAYDQKMTSGLSLAVGDVDGSGRDEIIVAPAKNAEPRVKVFDGSGNLLASFLAYDPAFRGGVHVAVGDIDGDGKAEIVTGPGQGGGPHIRVFDGVGNLKTQFFVGDGTDLSGRRVAVGDTQLQGASGIAVMPASGVAHSLQLFTGVGVLFGVVDFSIASPLFPFALGDLDSHGRSDVLVSTNTQEGSSVSAYDTDGKLRSYVVTYAKGTAKNPPDPFVLAKP